MSLGGISESERNKVIELDNKLSILRTKSNSLKNKNDQMLLVKDINTLIELINLNFSRSNTSSAYKERLEALYASSKQLRESVSSRDFDREIATRLYGNLKTEKDWNY